MLVAISKISDPAREVIARYARHTLNNIKKYRSLQRSAATEANRPVRRTGLLALCLGHGGLADDPLEPPMGSMPAEGSMKENADPTAPRQVFAAPTRAV